MIFASGLALACISKEIGITLVVIFIAQVFLRVLTAHLERPLAENDSKRNDENLPQTPDVGDEANNDAGDDGAADSDQLREQERQKTGLQSLLECLSVVFKVIWHSSLYLVFLVGYLLLRSWLINPEFELSVAGLQNFKVGLASSGLMRKIENPFLFHDPGSRFLKAMSWLVVMNKYAELLLCPTGFCAEYSFNCIKMIDSVDDPRLGYLTAEVFAIILFITALMYAVHLLFVLNIKRGKQHDSSNEQRQTFDSIVLLLVSGVWFVLPFLPASHLLVVVGTLVAERLLYIPSLGFSLMFAWVIDVAISRAHRFQIPMLVCALSYLAYYSMLTKSSVLIWKDDESLFLNAIQVCPGSAKMQMQYSQVLNNKMSEDSSFFKSSIYHLDLAKEIAPDWCDLDLKYAQVSMMKLDYELALDYYIDSLDCKYIARSAMDTLQKILDMQAEAEKAKGQVDQLLRFSLARVYEKLELYDAALPEYVTAVYAIIQNPLFDAEKLSKAAKTIQHVRALAENRTIMEPTVVSEEEKCEIIYVEARIQERLSKPGPALRLLRNILDVEACSSVHVGIASKIAAIRKQLFEGEAKKQLVDPSFQPPAKSETGKAYANALFQVSKLIHRDYERAAIEAKELEALQVAKAYASEAVAVLAQLNQSKSSLIEGL